MFLDFKVKMPSDSAGVLEKTRELHVLIIHKNITTAWEKGIRFLKSTSSGKCVDDDGKTMYPNTNFLKFFPSEELPEVKGEV